MDPRIQKELEKEEVSPFHGALLKHCRGLVDMSRNKMSSYYATWDYYQEVYSGKRKADVSDKKAEERGEPSKMVVPMTYAQVQAFVAFVMSLYTQRERLYELIPMGPEDGPAAKVGEALLERDLQYSIADAKLNQFLTDIGKYGLGVIKHGWVTETQMVRETVEQPAFNLNFLGVQMSIGQPKTIEVLTSKVKFQGNRLFSVSPYRFFPDTRLPISRFQEGEFCASEDEYTMTTLKQMEKDGLVAGVKYVKDLSKDSMTLRGNRLSFERSADQTETHAKVTSQGTTIITEVQVSLVPADFDVDGKPMGEETYPVKYNVWYANDQRIIKCEPLGYLHNAYTYDVAEFNPDQHNLISSGLAELVDHLQSVITWFINSHITSVRKILDNRLIVDPTGLEMSDLVERRPIIRLSANAARMGVDKFVKQLDVQDVTSNHTADANTMMTFMQIATGINDNALGQFHSGRRSASEARVVNSATASRLKLTASLIFQTAIKPLGQKLLSNLQDGLDQETYVKVMGDSADPMAMMAFKKVTRKDIVGNFDFGIFDGTLPSERREQADALQEFVMALMQVPELLAAMQYDVTAMIKEVFILKGVKNPDKFKLTTLNGQPTGIPQIPPGSSAGQGVSAPTAGAAAAPAV